MQKENLTPEERELNFYKNLIADYLKYGSVDEVFRNSRYDLPISYPGFHHILNRWHIVKAAGPNNKFSEVLSFFTRMVKEDLGIERLYQKMPPSFKEATSIKTLYRVLHHIKAGVDRRSATAIVVVREENPSQVLIGNDVSTPRLEYGKTFGSLSIPMGFSKRNENPELSLLRVMQREVFSDAAINQQFPYDLIPDLPKPFLNILAADVAVCVYKISISKEHEKLLSSYVLADLHFEDYSSIQGDNIRSGITEILNVYGNIMNAPEITIQTRVSLLNQALKVNYSSSTIG